MAYRLTEFDGVDLPAYNREANFDTAPALPGFVATLGGAYDSYGADVAPMGLPYTLTLRGIVSEETDANQRAAIDGMRALQRRRGKLVRVADDDDSEQWCWARLDQVVHRRPFGNRGYQVLEFSWSIESGWQQDQDDDEQLPTSSPHAQTVYNDGNRTVSDVIITFHADDANATAVTITTTNGTHLVWAGTLLAGDDLVFDCGAKSITNDGANAYDDLSYGAGHTIDNWISVEPGSMDITVTYTGGGNFPSVTTSFNHGWA